MLSRLVFLLLAYFSLVCGQLSWIKSVEEDALLAGNSNSIPAARSGASFGYHESKQILVLFGGESSGQGKLGDTWVFFLANSTWFNLQPNGTNPAARSHSVYGVLQGQNAFIVAYGAGASRDYNDVWSLDLNTWTWEELSPQGSRPDSRYGMYGGVFHNSGTELWIGGGYTTLTSDPRVYRPNIDIHRLRFGLVGGGSMRTWEKLTDNPSAGNQYNPFFPHGRAFAASTVVTTNKMVIFGGCLSGGTGGGPCPASDIWVYDVKTSSWTRKASCPSPRSGAAMVALTNQQDRVLLFGGTYGQNQIIGIGDYPPSELYVLDINGAEDKQWKRYKTVGDAGKFPGRRHGHAMVAGSNGTVYLFGGVSVGTNQFRRDLWQLSVGSLNAGDVEEIAPLCENQQFTYNHLHGLFMAIACGILLPVGFLVARYYRTEGKCWFILHIVVQVTAVLFAIIGFVIIFATSANPTPLYPHGIIGIIIMFMLLQQLLNGVARPRIKKERNKKSLYRVFWEIYHKISGFLTIILGFIQITLGLFLVIPPVAVWAVWVGVFGLWLIAFILHEIVKWIRFCVERRSKNNPSNKSGYLRQNDMWFDMKTF